MNSTTLDSRLIRHDLVLGPNARRVLLRPFIPSMSIRPLATPGQGERIAHLFSRVMHLDGASVEAKLDEVFTDFCGRHQRLVDILHERFEQLRPVLPTDRPIDESRRLLLASLCTNEYSLESSALFNPSIVPAPDQSGLANGNLRFYLSLRATGEGHISSITFRSGVIGPDGSITIDPVSKFVDQPRLHPAARYDLGVFRRKLQELGVEHEAAKAATRDLPDCFLMGDLTSLVRKLRSSAEEPSTRRAAEHALILARSNYTVRFGEELDMSEKVLFPYAPGESNGIEDARFVLFTNDDGTRKWFATYVAYDGSVVVPQLLETDDFHEFGIRTLNGAAVRNKGMALFPRKINGHYAMLGRQDGENIHLMFSDHLHFWYDHHVILRPAYPWEFVQLGNCGSPIETHAGWLVITHGVGPMRKYCIGAALLDLKDPSRVLARLPEPLVHPSPDEREGYVPNVVYSCGALIHHGNLVLPYAVSDTSSRFATIALDDVLAAMVKT